ncbi:MAG TPA: DUF192 domain-containing protein [bacterium]|jgi:uncharacterized membrane protein (UPF0127 family)|nr:DUF192 domain-containing protein [bacterium]
MRITQKITIPILFLLLTLAGLSCRPGLKSGLPVTQLTVDQNKILVEVANTEPTRMAGLMFRKDLGSDVGMLFVFADSQQRAFWMKNTLIPLSIAYMNEKGVVENILEMPPQTEQSFMSAGPAQFALEMNAGWFSKHGVKPGDVVVGASEAPRAKE